MQGGKKMSTEEVLEWMCKDMTFWYMESGDSKEILYPITEERQQIVLNILNEQADLMIYGKNFYTIDRDIDKTINKTSYMYYVKKASAYKKKRGKLILPYDLKDDIMVVMTKLLHYYQKDNIPYLLIMINDEASIKDNLTNALNPFSYLNLSQGKILIHRDMIINVKGKLVILATAENEKKLSEKWRKIKKVIQDQNMDLPKMKIIKDSEFDCVRQNLLLT